MRLVINTATLKKGGGIQAAVSFIKECIGFPDHDFHVFMSRDLLPQINTEAYPGNFRFYPMTYYPVSLRHRLKSVRHFKKLEKEIDPDCIFTVFGPSYWRPKAPHVMGFALGWTINPDSVAYKVLSGKKRILRKIKNSLLLLQAKQDADVFVGETEEVKRRLNKYGKIPLARLRVVSNTASHFFFQNQSGHFPIPGIHQFDYKLLTVSANYPHKNLGIIRRTAQVLSELDPEISYGFFLTIPDGDFDQLFGGNSKSIKNIGPVHLQYLPSIYKQCDAMLLPTLLESFSASYPEAMASDTPILTSDLLFAHTICEEAALYFDPFSPEEIAARIKELAHKKELQESLVEKGREQLLKFNSPFERTEKYLAICIETLS